MTTAVARPSLQSGPHLQVRVDVADHEAEVDAARPTSRHAADGKWEGRDPTAVDGAWVARVTIHRPDRPTRRKLVEWGWRGGKASLEDV